MAKKTIDEDPLVTDGIAVAREDQTRVSMSDLGRDMAERLAKFPKVKIFVPLPQGVTREKADHMAANGEKPPALPVALNGYTFLIRRGFEVSVPSPIADIVREAGIGG